MLENITYLCMGISQQKEMRRNVSTFDYVTCKRVDTRGEEESWLVSTCFSHIYSMVSAFYLCSRNTLAVPKTVFTICFIILSCNCVRNHTVKMFGILDS